MAEPIPLNAWRGRLQKSAKGDRKTLYNLVLYMSNLPGLGGSIRLNQLTGQIEWRGEQVVDTDYTDVQMIIEQAGFLPSKTDIPAALARVALDNAYHPIRDYLDGLKWDGVRRLDRFLPILFGTPDTEYERAVGAKFMIGAVARIYEPGCKMDTMLVLEGPQGLGKSSALRALFGAPYFTEMVNELRDHKKFVEQIQGKWVVEFAELSAIRRADVEMVKAIITMQVDKTRHAYARSTTELPRQCVLAASVNAKQGAGYLTDATGNRRFWPVACAAIDSEKLARKRDLLWAEAVVRYRDGEQWWMTIDEARLAKSQQARRSTTDIWTEPLEAKLFEHMRYTSSEILSEILKVPVERQGQVEKMRIADIMTTLGWVQGTPKINGKSTRVWIFKGVAE